MLEKCEEILFLAHACLQIGATMHPLNTAYTDREIATLVQDAEPRIMVCDPAETARITALCSAKVLSLGPDMTGTLGELAREAAPRFEVCDVTPGHAAALLYTSGTTGKAKGACITHGNLAESAAALAAQWGLNQSDRLLHTLPLYHAHGLLTAINSLFVAGGSITFLPRFEVDDVLKALPTATVLMGVPTHYARLTKEETRLGAACDNLRLIISGSAPLAEEISKRFFALTGKRIVERYGSTETAIVTAVPAGVPSAAGVVGWPLPGVEIRVLRQDGMRASVAAIGELETRGHNVFAGYWKLPEANAEAFTPDGWFITGDIAEIDATGCVTLLGRSKDLIISGGLNVYPKEVESALDTLLDGKECTVVGLPHPDFGEAVVAFVENDGPSGIRETELIANLRVSLASYKLPKKIIEITTIPRNRMGKVLKKELRETYGYLFSNELKR